MHGTCRRNDDPTDLRDRALLEIALDTGFRRAALSAIDVTDIDRATRSIVIIKKRGGRLRVQVGRNAWAHLERWLAWLRRRHVASGRVFRALRRCLDAELGWCVDPDCGPPPSIVSSCDARVQRRSTCACARTA